MALSFHGAPFYTMEHVAGRVLRDPALPELAPGERRAVYDAMSGLLATCKGVDCAQLSLSDYGKPGDYFRRQIARFTRQYLASRTHDVPAMDRLIAWLPNHVPEDDTTAIVHGDYQLYNLMLHPSEPLIVALLDWELSTLGHPMADRAYGCTKYHSREAATLGEGVPSEAEYIASYCERSRRHGISGWKFYLAFAFFRSAASARVSISAGSRAMPRRTTRSRMRGMPLGTQ